MTVIDHVEIYMLKSNVIYIKLSNFQDIKISSLCVFRFYEVDE